MWYLTWEWALWAGQSGALLSVGWSKRDSRCHKSELRMSEETGCWRPGRKQKSPVTPVRASGRNVLLKDLSEEFKPFSCHMERTTYLIYAEENYPAQSRSYLMQVLPDRSRRCWWLEETPAGTEWRGWIGRRGRRPDCPPASETGNRQSSDWLKFCYSHMTVFIYQHKLM